MLRQLDIYFEEEQQAEFLHYLADAEASVVCFGGGVVSGKPCSGHGHGGTVEPSRAVAGPPKAHYGTASSHDAL